MQIIGALILAAIFGAGTWFLGAQVIPDSGTVYFVGGPGYEDYTLTRLHLATGLVAFIFWSLGLILMGRRG